MSAHSSRLMHRRPLQPFHRNHHEYTVQLPFQDFQFHLGIFAHLVSTPVSQREEGEVSRVKMVMISRWNDKNGKNIQSWNEL